MNAAEFSQQLLQQGRLYQAVSPLPAASVQLRFTGVFEQKTIIWDAQIATLAYYFTAPRDPATATRTLRPFIEIGSNTEHGRLLRIGLNVTTIDDATIRKTMIMIRQYKRLQAGRHEYGEPYCATEGP
jgi:hypothetical protein